MGSELTMPETASVTKVAVLVVAAGRGTRAGGGETPKQYRRIGGVAVLRRTVEALARVDRVGSIQVVIHADDRALYDEALAGSAAQAKLRPPVGGGDSRQASVLNGLEALREDAPDLVLIHDAARPFVTSEVVLGTLDALAAGARAVVAAVPVADTLKRGEVATPDGSVQVRGTVERAGIWAAQTPQGFVFPDILEAHRRAAAAGVEGLTDDAAVAEWQGLAVAISPGDAANSKITTMEDLMQADRIIQLEEIARCGEVRVATAYDVHAFEPGDAVILGGIAIPHDRALKGHSDADVVLHALTDAILGALCDGDIGHHFPPSDPQWRGAPSDQFLRFAAERVRRAGGAISLLDATVVCERPKVGPHREAMRARIAEICGLPVGRVAVKATTSERLGFTGREEGIAAIATATLRLPFDYLPGDTSC